MADYHNKRQRGRGRRPGGGGGGGGHNNHGGGGHNQNPNRSMESSGPEGGKVRGPAALIYERYLQMARDAQSSDRVLSENYLQHADHYFRLVRSMQPATPAPQPQADRFAGGNEAEFEGEEETRVETEAGGEAEAGGEDEQPDVEFPAGQQQQGDREGGNRRRGRRNRFRSDGERGDREGGEANGEARAERGDRPERAERPERSERPERERRPPREQRESEHPEGFAVGPKPAFLRGGGD